jgi:outer membrane protein
MRSVAGLFVFVSVIGMVAGAAGAEVPFDAARKAEQEIRSGTPLSVDRCVELALAGNPSLRSSRENARATERSVLEAYATFLPGVRGGYDGSRSKIGYSEYELAAERTSNSHNIGLRVDQTVLSYSGIKGIHAARNRREADLAGYEADSQALAYEVRAACHTLLKTVDLLDVAEKILNVGEEQLKLAEKRKEVGAGVTADVLKAKAQVESNRLDVITAEKNLAVARASLLASMGLDVTLPIVLERPEAAEGEVPSFEASMEEAERSRPDLRQLEYSLRASRDGVGAARGEYLPSVGASFFYGWRDDRLTSEIFDDARNTWTASVSVDVPLFQVGAASRIRQQQAKAEAARLGLEATRKAAEFEIQEAILSIEESVKKVDVAARNVAAAEEDLRISQGKYEHGLVPILDLIEAQASLRRARAAQVEASYDHLTARAAWEKAVGRTR